MAAAGGGLASSVVFAGLSPTAPARGRFPGRPCSSRSRQRTGRRSKVGRLVLEEAASGGPREPRPVNAELTLPEDPSLLRVLRLSERLARQREAGFCTSGSDEVGHGNNEKRKYFFFARFDFIYLFIYLAPALLCTD